MKYLRNALYLGILLLTLLATGCQMGTAAPPPPSPPPPPPTSAPTSPLTKNNNPGPAAGIANNPNPGSILPSSCAAPPWANSITSFCANPAAGIGGASFIPGNIDSTPNIMETSLLPNNATCGYSTTGSTSGFKWICTGPQDSKIQLLVCHVCQPQNIDWNGNPPVCQNGYVSVVSDGTSFCVNATATPLPGVLDIVQCPSGTDYDNRLENVEMM